MDSLTDTAQLQAAAAWFGETAGAAASGYSMPEAQPTMIERSAAHGQMPPLLCRDVDEAYRVVEGEVTFFVEGEAITAGPGEVAVAPAGAAHTFRVESDAARWTVVTRVADLQRFIDFGRAVGAPVKAGTREWPSQSEAAAVATIAEPNGIELLGPPGALPGDPPLKL